MAVFGVTGPRGSGKTALLLRVIPVLVAQGLKVSTLTEAPPGFDIDKPGKDSHVHRTSGAREVLLASARRWALMHEYRDQPAHGLAQLLARLAPADLVLVEGFADQGDHPRLALWHPGLHLDERVVAVAAAQPLPGLDRPVLDVADAQAIAAFILKQVRP